MLHLDFSLPLKDPVLIFLGVLLMILLVPLIFEKLKIPSLVGLILAGMAFGPYGFNILKRDSSIILFGTVGLLYIMFLAALEIDLGDIRKNRNKILLFGFLTFIIPIVCGVPVSYYFLKFSLISSILLASMFASHTLLTYPVVSRMGMTKSRAVNVTVGGTVIADTLALLVLAVIASFTKGYLNTFFWIRLVGFVSLFSFIIFWGFPKLGRWFFKNLKSEGVAQYIFVLAMVFFAAFLAKWAGMEPIIGAFAAGLSLNRLIPHTSALMNRIAFVGNALFIPFFLIGVGMIVDVSVIFHGYHTLLVAVTMVIVATGCKWLAAFMSQHLFNFSVTERNLIFGLSNARAAATLAIVLVGFQLGLFDETILNGTVLVILVTCLISSFVTEKAARHLAISEEHHPRDITTSPQKILIPIANPLAVQSLLDFAIMIHDPVSPESISLLTVVQDNAEATRRVAENKKLFERAMHDAAATDTKVDVLTRVDLNAISGIHRAVKELSATDIIIGWSGQPKTAARIFGTTLDGLLSSTWQSVFVCHVKEPLHVVKRMVVLIPPYAEIERGFSHWLHVVASFKKQAKTKIVFVCSAHTKVSISEIVGKNLGQEDFSFALNETWEDFRALTQSIEKDDVVFFISSREGGVSHQSFLDRLPTRLAKHFATHNFVIIYPEQDHESSQGE